MPLLLDWLVQKYPLAKRTNLKRMVESGRVLVNGSPALKLKQPIADSDKVLVQDRPSLPKVSIEPLELVFEDPDLLVVNKPPGLLTSTNESERRPTAINIVRRYLAAREPKARAGIIHRLDRDASGLLVFSKNHPAFVGLKQQFFKHTARRRYTAVVRGCPATRSGRIDNLLVEYADGTVHVTRNPEDGEQAISDYQVIRSEGEHAWVQVRLETGKKHQVRVHMLNLGCPIVGDPLYGDPRDRCRMMLAATELAFEHPRTGQEMAFTIDPPDEFGLALKARKLPTVSRRPKPREQGKGAARRKGKRR